MIGHFGAFFAAADWGAIADIIGDFLFVSFPLFLRALVATARRAVTKFFLDPFAVLAIARIAIASNLLLFATRIALAYVTIATGGPWWPLIVLRAEFARFTTADMTVAIFLVDFLLHAWITVAFEASAEVSTFGFFLQFGHDGLHQARIARTLAAITSKAGTCLYVHFRILAGIAIAR